MNTEVVIPQLGGLVNLEVIDVLIKEGDFIEIGQPILILETDKASMEIVSDKAGLIQKILVTKGDKVSAHYPILHIKENDSGIPNVSLGAQRDELSEQLPLKKQTMNEVSLLNDFAQSLKTVYAGPAVRKLARELDVDLEKVLGSGTQGRITLDDLKKYVRDHQLIKTEKLATELRLLPDFSQWGAIAEKKLTSIRQKSAQTMSANWQNIPHVTHFEQANITELDKFRLAHQQKALDQGAKLTPLVFVIKAVTAALKEYPEFNSSLASCGTHLIMKNYINIGVAVETPEGLVVPVIHHADTYSLIELAIKLQDLSLLARQRRLSLAQHQGQTFTISSLGGLGGVGFTPIINWPDVAILGVSKKQQQPVWINDNWVKAEILPLSLSYDHRVIDGAQAARFSAYIAHTLEDIRTLLL